MLELGRGFAYVGNQKNLNVQGDDFFLDLLFYNYHLHCFIVFELKVADFKPEFAGKLNFYINTVNEQIKGVNDKPTIGVLLCKTPNETVVKYSLTGIESPIGVADYELGQSLPKQLKGEIPTIEEFEAEIEKEYEELKSPTNKKIERIKEMISQLKSEDLTEVKTPENVKRVYSHFLLSVKSQLLIKIAEEVANLFQNIEIMYWFDGRGFRNEQEAWQNFNQNENPYSVKIEIRLNAFKKAATNVFGVYSTIELTFSEYKYTYKATKDSTLVEKLYHQLPDEKEILKVIEQSYEGILDEIEDNLQRINNQK